MSFTHDGKSFLSYGRGKKAKLWSTYGELKTEFNIKSGKILDVKFSYDDDLLILRSSDGSVSLFDRISSQLITRISTSDYVSDICFAKESNNFFTSTLSGKIIKWSSKGEEILNFTEHSDSPINCKRYDEKGKLLTGSNKGRLSYW